MTNKELASKIDEFVRLGNELDSEAKRRYGKNGWLFHEADGGVYIMDGDSYGSTDDRQKHIKERSGRNARWGAGAW
jgi:hypothetical protein